MLAYTELKKGTLFIYEDQPYEVVESDFLRMQQRKAVVKTKIERFREIKAARFNQYIEGFKKIDGVNPLLTDLDGMIPHIFVVKCKDAQTKAGLKDHLIKNDVQAGEHYKPNHLLTFYKTDYELPKTMDFYHRCFSIPFHADLTAEEVDKVLSTIKGYFHGQN